MPLIIVFAGIIFLLLLMVKFKLNPFLGLVFTCFFVGILSGLDLMQILSALQAGFGSTMGKIALIIVFGAMLGKLLEVSGAAQVITDSLINAFGLANVQYAILITGFLVGLPMMYNASFLVMIPLIYTLSVRAKLPLMYLGIPLAATLSIAHAFLPPHPAPTYVSMIFGADINHVLLVGLGPVIPACLIAGIFLSKFFSHLKNEPPVKLFNKNITEDKVLPSTTRSIMVAVSPVLLMLSGTLLDFIVGPIPAANDMVGIASHTDYYYAQAPEVGEPGKLLFAHGAAFIKFISDATIALLLSVVIGLIFLMPKANYTTKMDALSEATNGIAMILLIIGAGGAFSEVLLASGVNGYIASISSNITINPLLVAFIVAAVFRFAVGSATVATMTAAPIVLPLATQYNISPELMVLATGSGSLMFSHFNDVGFWMFKEYFNVTIKQTFQIWTVMETLVALVGLTYCLLMNLVM